MDQTDIEKLIESVGKSTKEKAKELNDKINLYKASLDTQTRRKVRAFWIGVTIVTAIVFFTIGQWCPPIL